MWIVQALGAAIAMFSIIAFFEIASKAVRRYRRINTGFGGFDSAWSKLKAMGYRLERDTLGGWYVVNGRGELATNEVLYTSVDTASGKLEVFAKMELERIGDG